MRQGAFDWNFRGADEVPIKSSTPYTRVADRIFVGNFIAAKDEGFLSSNAISAVICLHSTVDEVEEARSLAKQLGIRFSHYPLIDGEGNSQQLFDKAVGAVETGVKDGNVLVACWAGRSRSVVVAAAAVGDIEQITSDSAMERISSVRQIAVSQGLLSLMHAHEESRVSGGIDLSAETA